MEAEGESDRLPTYSEVAAAHNDGIQKFYDALNNSEECKKDENSEGEVELPSLASILNRPIVNAAQFSSRKPFGESALDTDDDDDYDFADDSSDTSSDDGKRFLLKKAIGIDPEAIGQYDLKSVPENGSQYLMAVKNHNRKVPKVVTADPRLLEERIRKKATKCEGDDARNVKNKSDDISSADEGVEDDATDISELTLSPRVAIGNTEESSGMALEPGFLMSLLPDAEWKSTVLSDFIKLRGKVNRLRSRIEMRKVIVDLPNNVKLPDDSNNVIWQRFCLGTYLSKRLVTKNLFPHIQLDEFLNEFFSHKDESPPDEPEELKITGDQDIPENEHDSADVTAKSPVVRSAHFPLLSIILNIDQRSIEWLIKSHMSWFKCTGLLHSLQAKWIYALLVCIQEPLEGSVISDIREIAKKSTNMRSKLFKLLEKNPSHLQRVRMEDLMKYIATLTLFIHLVSNYFGQRDLSDELHQTL